MKRFKNVFIEFFQMEASSGIILLVFAVLAIGLANSPLAGSYDHFLHQELTIGFGAAALELSLLHWINDGLMAIFFFVIGMEIKREFRFGELQSLSATLLPIAAAAGGMVVPAVIYAVVNRGLPSMAGWGTPMATDIAFALGILAFVGRSAPRGIAVFLTALAIVDDLGGIIVIAIFYTEQLDLAALAAGLAVLAAIGVFFTRRDTRAIWPYLLGGLAAWYAFLQAGIHPTIAGVLLGLLIPAGKSEKTQEKHLLYHLEHRLEPWSAYFIMPVFALSNAGIAFDAGSLGGLMTPIGLGIILGLFLGKPLGIVGSAYLLIRSGLVKMPPGTRWIHFIGAGILGGIGFTMSLFIASLAFVDGQELMTAKMAIVSASLLSGMAGMAVFWSIAQLDKRKI
jgi:NhaA family Na+:H+ antiporter